MAVIDPATVGVNYSAESPHKAMLYTIPKVASGDTLDVSGSFSKVQGAVFLGLTESVYFLPTIAATTLTFTNANLNNTAGYLLVLGGSK